jgi:hypothetical protein
MKKISIYFLLLIAAVFTACEPSEDDKSLGSIYAKSDLKLVVKQTDDAKKEVVGGNYLVVQNNTPGTLITWDAEQGKAYENSATIFTPFKGTYKLICSVLCGGGVVRDTLTYTVNQMSDAIEKEPKYKILTGSDYQGKKWVLDMKNFPMGFFGTTYPVAGSKDNWSWLPDIAGNPWVGMSPDVDYGSLTFDMKGNYHVVVTRLDPNTKKPLTETGTFGADWASGFITLDKAEFPNIPLQYSVIPNWSKAKILEMSENKLVLGVYRAGDPAYIGFVYIPAK